MELIVETTGIAHRVPAGISSPQCRGSCLAVGALSTCSFTDNLGGGRENIKEYPTMGLRTPNGRLQDFLWGAMTGPVILERRNGSWPGG